MLLISQMRPQNQFGRFSITMGFGHFSRHLYPSLTQNQTEVQRDQDTCLSSDSQKVEVVTETPICHLQSQLSFSSFGHSCASCDLHKAPIQRAIRLQYSLCSACQTTCSRAGRSLTWERNIFSHKGGRDLGGGRESNKKLDKLKEKIKINSK